MSSHTIQLVDEFAPGYDEYIKNCQWYGPEMLFGMMYEYLLSGERLLDLGIGTGLSSQLFKRAGLEIYGLDDSEVMLQICRDKNIATSLQKIDLTEAKIPFNIDFHHVVSFAVFHFLENLVPLFADVTNNLKEGGMFGFSADMYNPNQDFEYSETSVSGVYVKIQETGLSTYKHSILYIQDNLGIQGFEILKSAEIIAFKDYHAHREVRFQLFVAKKCTNKHKV